MEEAAMARSSTETGISEIRGGESAAAAICSRSSATTSLANSRATSSSVEVKVCPCLLCSESFNVNDEAGKQFFLRHLLVMHHIVIGEIEEVIDLPAYCRYWQGRLRQVPATDVMSTIHTNTRAPVAPVPEKFLPKQETYYLLNKAAAEDASVRRELAVQKALEMHEFERGDETTQRSCLFCSSEFVGDRSLVIMHMFNAHNFNLGQPDNLVFVDDFLALLQSKLDNLQCLYCERIYKDRQTMKDHVRKKHHRKINPENKIYDRFYMVNYATGSGETWQGRDKEEEEEEDDDNDDNADEDLLSGSWTSGGGGSFSEQSAQLGKESLLGAVTCLFCVRTAADLPGLNQHMCDEHDFNLLDSLSKIGFYRRMRLVNFIRHRVADRTCVLCALKCDSRHELIEHMAVEKHFAVPDRSVWSDFNYLFPTDESDALLQQLAELEDGDDVESDDNVTLPEDVPLPDDDVMQLARQVRAENK